MEDVLELYAEPFEARRPQVCFDESPVQLVSERRQPLPLQPGQPACYDYEYKREGRANLFLFVQPLLGWRADQCHGATRQTGFRPPSEVAGGSLLPASRTDPAGGGQSQHA